MKPKMIMLVGLPASGKSTYAKTLDGTIFSSDALRAELWGNEATQGDNNKLFTELHRRIKNCLKDGQNAIYDATNINYKKRMAFLQELKHIDCEKICYLFATPYEECIKRNSNRDHKVPEYVIERMYKQFTSPYWYEGWDNIKIINNSPKALNSVAFVEESRAFSQDNSHHNLSLGEHCLYTYAHMVHELANKKVGVAKTDILVASLIHDNGKVFTKDFHNGKGEETEDAYYYNHQYVGAYNSFFYDAHDHLYVAQLIQWHMHPYMQWKDSEKAMSRDRKMLGEDLFNDVMTLHTADWLAH